MLESAAPAHKAQQRVRGAQLLRCPQGMQRSRTAGHSPPRLWRGAHQHHASMSQGHQRRRSACHRHRSLPWAAAGAIHRFPPLAGEESSFRQNGGPCRAVDQRGARHRQRTCCAGGCPPRQSLRRPPPPPLRPTL